jgi:putative transposase
MQLTQKIRIYPTKEQEKVLWDLAEKCRLIYNFALAERKEAYLKGEKITYQIQQNGLVLTKKAYPEYGVVYSKVLQMTLNQLDGDYRSFFALRRNGDVTAMPPHFKGKKYFTTMIYNQSGFRFERGCVKLSSKHPSGVLLCFAIPESYAFGKVYQVTVFQDEKDRYYLSIVYEKKVSVYVDNGLYQAFDLGVTKHTGVNVHGKFVEFANSRHDLYWNPRLDKLQSKRDRCKKKSRKWLYLNKTFKKLKRKSSRQTKDFQHKLSRKIVENTKANTIIVGDLNVKAMAQSAQSFSGLNRSTQNNGYLGRFVRFLTYKAELAGKKVIEIDESHTSKECYVCGKIHDMPLWVRVMCCDCGNVIDRDKNSSVDIMLRFLSQNALWTGYRKFCGNLRKTGLQLQSWNTLAESLPLRVG